MGLLSGSLGHASEVDVERLEPDAFGHLNARRSFAGGELSRCQELYRSA